MCGSCKVNVRTGTVTLSVGHVTRDINVDEDLPYLGPSASLELSEFGH